MKIKNDTIKRYVLQKINTKVFKNIENIMENIYSVSNHIKDKIQNKKSFLKFYKIEDKFYYTDKNSNCWRLCDFVENSTTFNKTDNLKVIEETGLAFGDFQLMLKDLDINSLNITIPNFHNTISRYEDFKKAVKEDKFGRKCETYKLINKYLNLEILSTQMYKLYKKNILPLRVTHNDTKCNNVLFNKDTFEYICVIDLDTVMPGLIGYDFGDAVRFCCNSADEDEKDLSKIYIDLYKYQILTKGFLSKTKNVLTTAEINTLTLGAITITIECGLRFLTDYLNGDVYFKTDYQKQNLDRAICQITLAEDMIFKYKTMKEIVNLYVDTKNIKTLL